MRSLRGALLLAAACEAAASRIELSVSHRTRRAASIPALRIRGGEEAVDKLTSWMKSKRGSFEKGALLLVKLSWRDWAGGRTGKGLEAGWKLEEGEE